MGGSGLDKLKELVDHFDNNLSQIKSQQYNETQARREFIDPFFTLLGWDVDNKQGYAEAYKDVIHEDAIKVGGLTKAPDYCFRIGGTRKFFVEAKKPGVNIKEDIDPSYQLRRYAWSAKLPLSILTDFEEFAIYDCRTKPNPIDKSSNGRVKYFNYTEYINEWDYLISTFSREAVLKGSFDKYVESNKAKKGTTEVDKAFLTEIEAWRDALARNIALRNPSLSTRELNFAVQTTIDRIIFLRICEDRGVEDYARLMALQNGEGVYGRLMTLFRDADEKYNSGLFHFEPEKGRETHDSLTPSLQLDDKVLKELIKSLYYPESPYEFSVVPADILGQVYEQFLGKVIRLTAGHQAKVEDKPEVKKAGGVYYTPTYIVDYIVKNTVGKILEGKTPSEVSKADHPVRILDPACGSGSFLLGAYEYLLTWYRDEYVKAGPEKYAKGKEPRLYESAGGAWKLTTSERKRILLNHIYGVDIDSQAVEVTKLSLLLKVLEGETKDSVSTQRRLFNERALPDLSKNIKCGNSLIGSDFYKDKQLDLFNEEERIRINAFDWGEEFKEVFKGENKGFDAVVGNPPYGMIIENDLKQYFFDSYPSGEGRLDNFELFIEKGIGLCQPNGLLGYIVPNNLLTNLYSRKIRHFLLTTCSINEINNFGYDVFSAPTVHTCVIIVEKGMNPAALTFVRKQVSSPAELFMEFDFSTSQKCLSDGPNETIDIFTDPTTRRLIERISTKSVPFGDNFFIRQCIKTGNDDEHVKRSIDPLPPPWVPSLRGKSIGRYQTIDNELYLNYGSWLARNWKNKDFYERPKIAVRETGNRITATIDLEHRYFLSSLYSIYAKTSEDQHDLMYVLGLLNSRLATYFIKIIAFELTKGAFTKIRTNQLARYPFRIIDFGEPADASRHSRMVSLVSSMLSLHKQLQSAKTEQDKTIIQRQINATDKEIDRLVYELYELTPEEIKIVEGQNEYAI